MVPVQTASDEVLPPLPSEISTMARKAAHSVTGAIHLTANEPSLGLYQVHSHVQRTVPVLMERKREFRAYDQRVRGVLHDMNYTREVTTGIGALTAFSSILASIQHTVKLKQEIDRAASIGFRVETMQTFHFGESPSNAPTMEPSMHTSLASIKDDRADAPIVPPPSELNSKESTQPQKRASPSKRRGGKGAASALSGGNQDIQFKSFDD